MALVVMLAMPFVQENNLIRVYNSGDGIPVEMHKEENVYVPELIFGHLLTSSNYNDNEKKVWLTLTLSCGADPCHSLHKPHSCCAATALQQRTAASMS